MGTPLKVTREEHTAQELRRLASDMKDAGQARRVHAISFVMDGWSRARAAAFGCVDRQTLRDWVERRHDRLPITKTFRFRPSSHANGIPLKGADFPSSRA
jgi:hypothetical protein